MSITTALERCIRLAMSLEARSREHGLSEEEWRGIVTGAAGSLRDYIIPQLRGYRLVSGEARPHNYDRDGEPIPQNDMEDPSYDAL